MAITSLSKRSAHKQGASKQSGGPAKGSSQQGSWEHLDRPAPPMGYIPGLDGIRAIAVLGVLLYHAGSSFMPGGFLGVDVFFVLSGFLISTLLLQQLASRGKIDFKQFYIHRARRLLPALLLTIALTAVLVLILARDGAAQFRHDAVASFAYVTNWGYILGEQSYFQAMGRPPLLQHLWSLSVEEQFYLLWPIALAFLYRWRGRRGVGRVALYVALGSTLLMAVLSILWNVPGGGDASRLYFGTDSHCMGLLLGAALAAVWRPGALPRRLASGPKAALTAVAVGSVIVVVLSFMTVQEDSNWLYRGGFLVVSGAAAVMIALTCHPAIALGSWLAVAPLRYIGTRSYGLYLYHWPIFMVTRPDQDLPFGGFAAFVLRMGLTFAVAEASYRYVEKPIRRGALVRLWHSTLDLGWPASGKRIGAVVGGISVAIFVVVMLLLPIPAPNAKDYLGGVTETGAGSLQQSTASGQAPSSAPAAPAAPASPAAPAKAGGPVETGAKITAIGDSVMLGARDELKKQLPNVTVDAAVGRQSETLFGRIDARKASSALDDVVVLHTGTNGPAPYDDLVKALQGLSDRHRVVLVTVHGAVRWQGESNANIRKAAALFPNVRVADWAEASDGHGEYFVSDGTHLTSDGLEAYAKTIVDALKSP